jgi:hypothetical protein
VQTLDGRWLSIDGRLLFKANVAASETYNTALERQFHEALGVRFAERPGTDPAKRPIREIVGIDLRLNQRWWTRRAHINIRRSELAIQFQKDHGRPPTLVEALHLAQQATKSLHLADLACPRRGPTAGPHRGCACRAGECADGSAGG